MDCNPKRLLTSEHTTIMSEADNNLLPIVKKHKRGDVRKDGKVFWNLQSNQTEYWVSKELFLHLKKCAHEKYRASFKSKATGKPRGKKPDSLEVREAKKREKYIKYRANPEQVEKQRLARIAWQKRNKDRLNAKHKEKRDNDPIFATAHRIRRLTNFAFERKGYKKNGTTEQVLGCTWEELKVHIESKFLPGMNWENRNQWHIDHIIPLASAKTPKEIEDLCKWHNLQPLWREDNLKKGAKLITAHIDLG
jgi:hypothetical protein